MLPYSARIGLLFEPDSLPVTTSYTVEGVLHGGDTYPVIGKCRRADKTGCERASQVCWSMPSGANKG